MADVTLRENLSKVREKFKNEHPDALNQIEAWEKRVSELSAIESFCSLDTTKSIVKGIKDRMVILIRMKILDKNITAESMNIYGSKIEELQFFLSLVSPKFEKELEEINTYLVQELSE